MNNRCINGTILAFHAAGPVMAATLIGRILMLIAEVHMIGTDVPLYLLYLGGDLGDGYSLLFLFCMGFLMYHRHTGLSGAVNLSVAKRLVAASVISIVASFLLAALDIAVAKLYFSELYQSRIGNDEWYLNTFIEEYILPSTEKFTCIAPFTYEATCLFIKMTAVYFSVTMLGYAARHMLTASPKRLTVWCVATVVLIYLLVNIATLPNGVFVPLFLITSLVLLISVCPAIFLMLLVPVCLLQNPCLLTAGVIAVSLLYLAIILFHMKKHPYSIPKENRKGVNL